MSAPGDLVFKTGKGASAGNSLPAIPDGSFRFVLADGTEVLRIESIGAVYVRGQLVDSDASVYQGFRAWLLHARHASGQVSS